MLLSKFGYHSEYNGWKFGFGNKNLSRSDLIQSYPHCHLFEVHQTHSAQTCLLNSDSLPNNYSADSIVSSRPNLLMIIKTADCLPVLFIPENPEQPAAIIHAGWKGLVKQILLFTAQNYLSPAELKNYQVWIGPHIIQSSFEVAQDVAQLFVDSLNHPQLIYKNTLTKKYHIHLLNFAIQQLTEAGFNPDRIHIPAAIDTMTNPEWYSARRGDQAPELRNLAWLVRPN